jgi:ATP/maltotriose-dependent transcriptional regulator MalT
MRRLAPHHGPRPRLTDRCANYHVIVGEAAAGYGKSVLGTELVDSWWGVGIDVQLEHEGVTAPVLGARLRAAALQAGFTDAAASAANTWDDAFGAVDALVSALACEPCAFLIDDVHNAGADASQLIDHIAERLEAEQRLVILARHLPKRAARLRRAEYLHLTSADLAMTADETLELCRSGFEVKIGPHVAKVLDRATGGWTAATVLAAARAARTGEAIGVMAEAAIWLSTGKSGGPLRHWSFFGRCPVAALGSPITRLTTHPGAGSHLRARRRARWRQRPFCLPEARPHRIEGTYETWTAPTRFHLARRPVPARAPAG